MRRPRSKIVQLRRLQNAAGVPFLARFAIDEPGPEEVCAAEYVRMSTEHQRYSINYQRSRIAEYALINGIRVVQSYIDPGKSGVRIEGRAALKNLINDVQSGDAPYSLILVYDVSRWGRFQDIDESAYYEFICKKSGIPVRYCAEQFENNESMISQVVKGLKRAMAGEYSRELSVKVSEAQRRAAMKGECQGGNPPYAFRRLLIDSCGKPRAILKPGERKHFETDSVVLTLGPKEEIATVRRIFYLYVKKRMTREDIARLLNSEGRTNSVGNLWNGNHILRLLKNEKYIGNFVYGRTSKKMYGPTIRTSPKTWVRAAGALTPIISQELFSSAQNFLKNPEQQYSTNLLLDYLTAAFCKHGHLSVRLASPKNGFPSYVTYRERFGSFNNAVRLIGYKKVHNYHHCDAEYLRPAHRQLIAKLVAMVQTSTGEADYDEAAQVLVINKNYTIGVTVIPYTKPKSDLIGWTLRLYFFSKCDAIFAARLNKANNKILDYHLLPRKECPQTVLRFTESNTRRYKKYKLASLHLFYRRCKRLSAHRQAVVEQG